MTAALHQRPVDTAIVRGLAVGLWALIVLGAWMVYMRPASMGGSVSYVVVNGPSMQPALHDGDLTMLRRRPAYRVGEVVAFRAEGGVAIHRVVGIDAEGRYVMQGDNKPATDPWLPSNENILGELVFRIPYAGHVYQQYGALIFGWLIGLLACLIVFRPSKRREAVATQAELSELEEMLRRRRERDALQMRDEAGAGDDNEPLSA